MKRIKNNSESSIEIPNPNSRNEKAKLQVDMLKNAVIKRLIINAGT